ncbi:MAG TPA: dNTP triphosphohydrolase [Thermoleophilaceae bacterium]
MEKLLTVPSEELVATLDSRRYDESPPSTRSEAQRDRDRILYSSALLRLGQVTQVAAPEVGHSFHSRLTHSLKVAQVARGLAQRLNTLAERDDLPPAATALVACLDEDATEAAALGHDLGHPPFGHLAEQVLQSMSQAAGSFEGNAQSFRIVTRLALRSELHPGLNLTRRTLNGLLKYPWLREDEEAERERKWGAYGTDRRYFVWAREGVPEIERTLEAELMDWADDVTYAVHDMDDFYRAGLIPLDRLTSSDQERGAFADHLRARRGERAQALVSAADRLWDGFASLIRTPFAGRAEERVNLRSLGSALIGRYIAAVELDDASDGERVLLSIDDEVVDEVTALKELTWFYIIRRPSLAIIQRGQAKVIEALYEMYREAAGRDDPSIFPPVFAERLADAGTDAAKDRVVIDLIAGMTEASALEIYRQNLGVSVGSLLMRAAGPS